MLTKTQRNGNLKYIKKFITSINVRTAKSDLRLREIIQTMYDKKLGILLIQETRRRSELVKVNIENTDYTCFFSGDELDNRYHGVGIIIQNSFCKVIEVQRVSNRIIVIKLSINNFRIRIINVYAPTDVDNKEINSSREMFYENLQCIYEEKTKKMSTILTGDWNCNLRFKNEAKINGYTEFSTPSNSKNSELMKNFLIRNSLCLPGTFFRHKFIHRFTHSMTRKKTNRTGSTTNLSSIYSNISHSPISSSKRSNSHGTLANSINSTHAPNRQNRNFRDKNNQNTGNLYYRSSGNKFLSLNNLAQQAVGNSIRRGESLSPDRNVGKLYRSKSLFTLQNSSQMKIAEMAESENKYQVNRIIDHFVCTNVFRKLFVVDSRVFSSIDFNSDHRPITMILKLPANKKSRNATKIRKSYSKVKESPDYEKLQSPRTKTNTLNFIQNNLPKSPNHKLLSKLLSDATDNLPRKSTKAEYHPWDDDSILRQLHQNKQRARRTGNKQMINLTRKIFNNRLRIVRNNYYRKIANDINLAAKAGNHREIWRLAEKNTNFLERPTESIEKSIRPQIKEHFRKHFNPNKNISENINSNVYIGPPLPQNSDPLSSSQNFGKNNNSGNDSGNTPQNQNNSSTAPMSLTERSSQDALSKNSNLNPMERNSQGNLANSMNSKEQNHNQNQGLQNQTSGISKNSPTSIMTSSRSQGLLLDPQNSNRSSNGRNSRSGPNSNLVSSKNANNNNNIRKRLNSQIDSLSGKLKEAIDFSLDTSLETGAPSGTGTPVHSEDNTPDDDSIVGSSVNARNLPKELKNPQIGLFPNLKEIADRINQNPPDEDEIVLAVKSLKNNRSALDFQAEILKVAIQNTGFLRLLVEYFGKIWTEGVVPEGWGLARMTAIWKKKGLKSDPTKYRAISVGSTMCKIAAKIYLDRFEEFYNCSILDNQCGFRQNRGTDDALFNFKNIQVISKISNRPLYTVAIDYSSAFDTLDRALTFEIIERRLGREDANLNVIKNLYGKTSIYMSWEREKDAIETSLGVRQGGIESPQLYTFLNDTVLRVYGQRCRSAGVRNFEIKYRIPSYASTQKEISEGTITDSSICYADDTSLMFDNKEDANNAVKILQEVCTEFGLKINLQKSETMISNPTNLNQNSTQNINGLKLSATTGKLSSSSNPDSSISIGNGIVTPNTSSGDGKSPKSSVNQVGAISKLNLDKGVTTTDKNNNSFVRITDLSGSIIHLKNRQQLKLLGAFSQSNSAASIGNVEVGYRIACARTAFRKHQNFFTNYKIKLCWRKTIMNALVRGRLCYGCRSWRITNVEMSRLSSFWNSCVRSLIPGGQSRKCNSMAYRYTNKKIFEKTKMIELPDYINNQRSMFLQHIIRGDNSNLSKKLLFHDEKKKIRGKFVYPFDAVLDFDGRDKTQYCRESISKGHKVK